MQDGTSLCNSDRKQYSYLLGHAIIINILLLIQLFLALSRDVKDASSKALYKHHMPQQCKLW